MNDIITQFHCKACDCILDEWEIASDEELKGMCFPCYEDSMDAAYDDLPNIFEDS